ncbi:guanylate kinase [Candidatus Peregrinibacteria bacterium CG10_big_fil_rev_8_21_14_0_10_36_19]|nr:MAG: guanylate kinase [Candidatus Peregrinibacteria bacterium CG10_big_fil_rev_8_21_14_0_10_36_19]
MQGKLFLIVGPSGSGKGTVIGRLKQKYPGFVYPVSYTTREPRPGEVDGEVYNFISKEKFKAMMDAGEFLEYAVVHSDNYYGTSKAQIVEPLEQGAVVIREVDIQGFFSIRDMIPAEHMVSIFMKVSDMEDLRSRIMKRGSLPEDEVQKRLESAQKEIAQAGECDYQVENKWGDVTNCLATVERIVLEEIKDLY